MFFSDSDCVVRLLLEERHVFLDGWLVHLMANVLKDFSEGLLISLTHLTGGKFKVDLGQVHTDGACSKSFK